MPPAVTYQSCLSETVLVEVRHASSQCRQNRPARGHRIGPPSLNNLPNFGNLSRVSLINQSARSGIKTSTPKTTLNGSGKTISMTVTEVMIGSKKKKKFLLPDMLRCSKRNLKIRLTLLRNAISQSSQVNSFWLQIPCAR